jgi:hypothetical protein
MAEKPKLLHAVDDSIVDALSVPTTPDPFDAKALALPPDFFVAGGAANPKPKNVQVRKPHDQEWIRVHPDPAYRGNFGTILLRDDREFYLLAPPITTAMRGHRYLKTVTIYTTYSRLSAKTFLWPVGIVGYPGQNKRTENWYRTAHEAAEAAMRQLVNVWPDMEGGGYEWKPSENPEANTPPVWPELTFNDLLQIGFQRTGCFVDSFDHDVFKKLKAEL